MTVWASNPLVSVVFVCYRSSAFLGRAVESLRREAVGEGVPLEVLIVDHSEDPREQEALQKLQPEALLLAPNRGYAAGLNLGLRHARGQYFIAANPDLTFAEGSLRALLAALRGSFAVVGPQFTMGPWLFPAADPQHPLGEVRTWLSLRWRFVWQRVWRSWVKNQENLWQSEEPLAVTTLSGALLAFERPLWKAVGPFDEGFFLYFEETDWLRRVRKKGLRLGFVPQARVSHHWAHVANGEWARLHLARSKNRYFRKHFPLFSLFLPLFGGHCKHFWPDLPAQLILPFTRVLWLLSPSPLGFPAAGYYGGGVPPWTSLAEARTAHPGQPFWLAATRPGGVTFLGMWRLG